jgi:diacylglycerol kinase (ATP)
VSAPARVAVLTNPTAGRGRQRDVVGAVVRALAEDPNDPTAAPCDVRVLDATDADSAVAACRRAVEDGADALVTVGGDGTVHIGFQAVAGVVRDGRPVPMGIVAAGTGNDFAVALGLPTDPVVAARAVAAALRSGRTRSVDLARMSGPDGYTRWYGAVLGAGFDAVTNERANAMRWPKGRLRYEIATYVELLRLHGRRYTLTLDGVAQEVDAVLVAVGNTASYGGGFHICPAADPADGQLDIVVGLAMSRPTMVRLKSRVYAGTHVHHPKVRAYRARSVTIAAEGIVAYADGERTCPLPVTITAVPGALALLG